MVHSVAAQISAICQAIWFKLWQFFWASLLSHTSLRRFSHFSTD